MQLKGLPVLNRDVKLAIPSHRKLVYIDMTSFLVYMSSMALKNYCFSSNFSDPNRRNDNHTENVIRKTNCRSFFHGTEVNQFVPVSGNALYNLFFKRCCDSKTFIGSPGLNAKKNFNNSV
jgi:hypothetical protein